MSKLLLILFFSSVLISCKQKNNSQVKIQTNDTISILKLILDTNFLQRKLPEYYSLFKGKKSGDTMLCVIDSTFPKSYIPSKFGNSYLKVIDKNNICSILQSTYDSTKPINYLEIVDLEKKDSTFYIQISSLSCLKYGGGIVGIYIVKQKNKFAITNSSGWSIN